MSHELDTSNGRDNMAFVGDVPWHGLGSQLTPDADLQTWQKEAGMDWKIRHSAVRFQVESEDEEQTEPLIHEYTGRRVLHRSDTKAPLSIVSDDYKIVQPSEVIEFFKNLVSIKGFKMETAGCLFGGKKFWALARAGESFKLQDEDEIKPYLLLATSCDGSMSTVAHPTSIRVVCNNTLRMAIGKDASKAKIKVSHLSEFDPDKIKEELGLFEETWSKFIKQITTMSKIQVSDDDAIELLADSLKFKMEEQLPSSQEILDASSVINKIFGLYKGAGVGSKMKSSEGTGWGLVNAVTEYFDHHAGASQQRSRAFERAVLTDRAQLKSVVASKILELA